MTRTQINVAMIAILTTLDETESAPSGVLCLALQSSDPVACTTGAYLDILALLAATGMVTVEAHMVTITRSGRDMVQKIKAASPN